jgi:hypothetical protein
MRTEPDSDTTIRDLVLEAYRAAPSSKAHPKGKFDAALKAYCDAYPNTADPVARHAVARIVATDGDLAGKALSN